MHGRPPGDQPADPPAAPDIDPGIELEADVRTACPGPEPDPSRPPEPDAGREPLPGRGRAASPRRIWSILAVIAAGGGLGSVARHLVGQAFTTRPGAFPWATFLVNVSGCFALGCLMVFVLSVWPPRWYVRPFFAVGLLGGYTTFSTFTVEIVDLVTRGVWTSAAAYAVGSLIVGLVAVWAGGVVAGAVAGRAVRNVLHRRAKSVENP
ncbi:fluoride efflux transporter CrcB [Sphaerimonospora sp. CA-214678]|uniref:fluoride efflux transporter CrcB n=1 Tax=Sphaerimonospora sp. CA-214678 TaxID=3240029 RepID=UPI003D8AB02D